MDSDLDLDVRSVAGEQYLREKVISLCQSTWESNGHVMPFALIYGSKNPDGTPLEAERFCAIFVGVDPSSMSDDGYKEQLAGTLRDMCAKCDAIAVAFVSEAWTVGVSPKTLGIEGLPQEVLKEKLNEYVDAYPSLGECPRRKEIVMVTWEHCTRRHSTMWFAPITREIPLDETSKGTLETFREVGTKLADSDVAFPGFDDVVPDDKGALPMIEGRFTKLLPGAGGN